MPDVIRRKYSAPVATAGTLVFNYPAGRTANDYRQDSGAVFFPRALQNTYTQGIDFTLVYSDGFVTLTWLNPITIPYDGTVTVASGDRFDVGIELPLSIDAATVLPPADGNDTYNFT